MANHKEEHCEHCEHEHCETIELMDEEGKKYTFECLLVFDVDEKFYIAMTPIGAFEDFQEDEVLIMQVKEDENGGDTYLPIETEEELDMLWDIFQDLYYAEEEENETDN